MTAHQRRKALRYLRAYPVYRLAALQPQVALQEVPVVGEWGSQERLVCVRRRRAIRKRLRLHRHRAQLVERGLQALTPVERLVLEKLCIHPVMGNADRLCQLLGCEKTTVYRRRANALTRFCAAVF